MTESRKLAVIMFTDIAGYSALAQRNEALAAGPASECTSWSREKADALGSNWLADL